MKYVKESTIVSGAKDSYSVVAYNIDVLRSMIFAQFMFVEHVADGTVKTAYYEKRLENKIEYYIDPAWDENSTPAKPVDFDSLDPSTWGELSWDDIPRILNPDKLYCDLALGRLSEDPIDQVIFETLVLAEELPTSTEWSFI